VKYNVLFKNSTRKVDFSSDTKSYTDLLQRTTTPGVNLKDKIRKIENSFSLSKKNSKIFGNERTNTYSNLFTEESVRTNCLRTNENKSMISDLL